MAELKRCHRGQECRPEMQVSKRSGTANVRCAECGRSTDWWPRYEDAFGFWNDNLMQRPENRYPPEALP